MEFKKMVNNPICKTEKETQMYRTDFWTLGEGEGGMIWENSIETCILSSVKQIASPGWMHETSAQGRCTRKTQRDGMGRELGGGSGWGGHVNPWLIHVNVWQKPLQYCKVISLQLIKINEKKNSACMVSFSPSSFLKTFIYLYMIVLGLSCGMWDLVLQCAGCFSLVVPHRLHSALAPGFVACRLSLPHPHLTVVVLACGILVPPPGIKLSSPAL